MAKIQIKSEKLTPFGGIFSIMQENISYTSDTGKNNDFNTADTLNTLLLNCMFASGQLKEGEMYDVDFDHQFIETENKVYADVFHLISPTLPQICRQCGACLLLQLLA